MGIMYWVFIRQYKNLTKWQEQRKVPSQHLLDSVVIEADATVVAGVAYFEENTDGGMDGHTADEQSSCCSIVPGDETLGQSNGLCTLCFCFAICFNIAETVRMIIFLAI